MTAAEISVFLLALGTYLERTAFCKYPCTSENIVSVLADMNIGGAIEFDAHLGVASVDGSYVTFEREGWTVNVTEEIHAINIQTKEKVWCPPI